MPTEVLLLIHKTLGHAAIILISAGVFTAIDFTHTISLGSIMLGFLLIVGAGVVTVRSKIAAIWREEAEGERAAKERAQEELADTRADRAQFEREQQELRHELKNQVAATTAQLKVLEAKTDLTLALESIRQMNEETVDKIAHLVVDTFVKKSKEEHAETHRLLEEIRDKLPKQPE